MNNSTGAVVAIKKVPRPKISSSKELQTIMSEIELLSYLAHPNIVQYYKSFNTDDHLHIVLEFVENGSLQGLVKKWGVFPEELCGNFMGQVRCLQLPTASVRLSVQGRYEQHSHCWIDEGQ